MTRAYGSKYDEKLSTVEIASLIRADIKAAVKAGDLPKGKYSVRCQSYSGGCSIDVKAGPLEGLSPMNPERIRSDVLTPYTYVTLPILSAEGSRVLSRIDAMMAAYNHDGSDIQTDYFDVRFYGHAEFSSKWQAAERARIEDEMFPLLAERRQLMAETSAVYCDLVEQKTGKRPTWVPENKLFAFCTTTGERVHQIDAEIAALRAQKAA